MIRAQILRPSSQNRNYCKIIFTNFFLCQKIFNRGLVPIVIAQKIEALSKLRCHITLLVKSLFYASLLQNKGHLRSFTEQMDNQSPTAASVS